MSPASKTKESVATRLVPPSTGPSRAEGGAHTATKTVSAQKFMVWPEDRREQIASMAYDLWKERGCRHGHDLEDWLDAEAVVRKEIHKARE